MSGLVNLYADPPCFAKDADDFPATMGQLRNSISELIQPPREAVYFLRAVAAQKFVLPIKPFSRLSKFPRRPAILVRQRAIGKFRS